MSGEASREQRAAEYRSHAKDAEACAARASNAAVQHEYERIAREWQALANRLVGPGSSD